MKLSAIILTQNQQQMLPNCLKSIQGLVDEIIICDRNSTDDTLSIAKKANAKIVKYSGQYFDEWRNLATQAAKSEWILYIDADERLTPSLKKEIKKIVISSEVEKSSKFSAYQISRQNYWWGKEFTHCGASPDFVTRLIKKDKLKKWQGIIHESPIIDGDIGTLKNKMLHFTHRDLISGLQKSYQWTKLEAQLFYQAGHKC